MGGLWIPESFIAAHELWPRVKGFADPTGFYAFIGIRREGVDKLILSDRDRDKIVTTGIDDNLIEVFAALKKAGEDSVIVVDRGSEHCWITSRQSAEEFLKYHNDQQDEDYGPP